MVLLLVYAVAVDQGNDVPTKHHPLTPSGSVNLTIGDDFSQTRKEDMEKGLSANNFTVPFFSIYKGG